VWPHRFRQQHRHHRHTCPLATPFSLSSAPMRKVANQAEVPESLLAQCPFTGTSARQAIAEADNKPAKQAKAKPSGDWTKPEPGSKSELIFNAWPARAVCAKSRGRAGQAADT
jgi:hypothetical protein